MTICIAFQAMFVMAAPTVWHFVAYASFKIAMKIPQKIAGRTASFSVVVFQTPQNPMENLF